MDQVRRNLEEYGLKLVSIIPDHFGEMKWGKGAFTSKDPAIRKQAVEDTKELMDISAELGGNLISAGGRTAMIIISGRLYPRA